MKFRTDFVANSSDSNFLVFHVKNQTLFKCLTNLGTRFWRTPGQNVLNLNFD